MNYNLVKNGKKASAAENMKAMEKNSVVTIKSAAGMAKIWIFISKIRDYWKSADFGIYHAEIKVKTLEIKGNQYKKLLSKSVLFDSRPSISIIAHVL